MSCGVWLTVWACAAAAEPAVVPPGPVPTGMDLLYSDRTVFLPNGEPLITLGIASGLKVASLAAKGALTLDYYEQGVFKHVAVPAGKTLRVAMVRSEPAERREYVDLESVSWGQTAALETALKQWRGRGLTQVQALEEGTLVGIGGHVIDNREYRLILPISSHSEGEDLLSRIFGQFGVRASISARLLRKPWGELRVFLGETPLGLATSFVLVKTTDAAGIEVRDVEFGQGYSWHAKENRSYRGDVYVAVDSAGALAVVNLLGAETVLEGVVPAEMYASAHPEALKAQAIAARNELFAKLGRRHHADPFHLCSEQHCQVYAGIGRQDPRTSAAVQATAGMALFHGEQLVDTVYSSSCGGYSEDNDAVWGQSPDAALRARPDFDPENNPLLAPFAGGINSANVRAWVESRPEVFCAHASVTRQEKFRWTKSFDAAELNRLVAAQFANVGAVRDLQVGTRGTGGRVVSLEIIGESGHATIVHELPIRQLFGNLNSGSFVIDLEHDTRGHVSKVHFRGAGWGHGAGMCQTGAVGRAEAGQSYVHILQHYYTDTHVMQLYGSQN